MNFEEDDEVAQGDGRFEISAEEMYKQMDCDDNIIVEQDGLIRTGINFRNQLFTIEKFVKEIASTKKLAFETNEKSKSFKRSVSITNLGEKYLPLFNSMIDLHDHRLDYSEHIKVFFDVCQEMCLDSGVFDGKGRFRDISELDIPWVFNELIVRIRETCTSKGFRRKLAIRKNNSVRNFLSLQKYVDDLFDRYSRMLILRIDFAYKEEFSREVNDLAVSNHRENFLNNMRSNSLFENLLGYIWKLEYGEDKGYHFHFAFFFDGAKVRQDAYLASKIGKYWQENITKGHGTHFNCNRSKSLYKRLGIGMVSHYDTKKREDLMFALSYLTKKEQYLRTKLPRAGRTFGKGQPRKPKVEGLGRPRRSAN